VIRRASTINPTREKTLYFMPSQGERKKEAYPKAQPFHEKKRKKVIGGWGGGGGGGGKKGRGNKLSLLFIKCQVYSRYGGEERKGKGKKEASI